MAALIGLGLGSLASVIGSALGSKKKSEGMDSSAVMAMMEKSNDQRTQQMMEFMTMMKNQNQATITVYY